MKRVIAVLIVASIILSGLSGAQVWAGSTGAVTLSDTGWSDPAVGSWDAATRTATLAADLAQAIVVTGDHLTLDGAGHTLSGSAGSGIDLSGRTGVEVRNLTVRGFTNGLYLYGASGCTVRNIQATGNSTGIYLESASGNTITGCTASSNSGYGLYLLRADGNTLSENTANGNGCYGIYLSQAHHNALSGNTAGGNAYDGLHIYASNGCILTGNSAGGNREYGLRLDSCSGATLSGNAMAGNGYNFRLDAQTDAQYNHTIDTTNTVDGKPIYYVRGASGQTLDGSSNAGTIYLIDCSDMTLRGLSLSKNGFGALLWNVQRAQIEGVQATGNSTGLWLRHCSASILSGVSSNYNSYAGIHLEYSDNNLLLDSQTAGNSYCGVYLQAANSNALTHTIFLQNANGLIIRTGSNNQVCNNSFLKNNAQASVSNGVGNVFSLPAPVGGNYWSNWTAPNSNNDPYVDNPYSFNGGRDDLPWAKDQGWNEIDAIAPTTTSEVTGSLGNNGWYISAVTVTLRAADNPGGSGVRTTEYSLDGAAWAPYAAPLVLIQEGRHTLQYRSSDNRDNVEAAQTLTLQIDRTPPVLNVRTPQQDATLLAGSALDFDAADAVSGLANITATLTDGANTALVASGYQPEAGSYTLTIEASDVAGNRVREQYAFTVDYRPCTINGAGLLPSPAGADPSRPSLSGRATVHLLAVTGRGASSPQVQLNLKWPEAGLSLRSTSCSAVTVRGNLAQIRGMAAIGNEGGYCFLVSALDNGPGSDAQDEMRVRVWESASGRIVYDNQPGAADTDRPLPKLQAGDVLINCR